jgi:hypothetical protein
VNKRVFLPIIITLWLAVTGCTTTTYLVRTFPPEIVLNSGDRIGFVNLFDYRSNALIKEKHDTAYFEGISAFAKTLTADTLPDRLISFFLTDDNAITQSPTLFQNSVLPEQEIRSFCRDNQATHLLTLDSLKIGFDWETTRETDEDGSVSKTKYFYLFSNYFLSLYDSSGAVVKNTLLKKSMAYSSRPTLSGLITIQPKLAKAREKIAILAHEAAMQYTDMFYPSEERLPKSLKTGKPFEETNAMIQNKEYDAAILLLTEMVKNPRKSVSKKAQKNLVVARELKENQKSEVSY